MELNTELKIEDRRRRSVEAYLAGETMMSIAKTLGVSAMTICRDIRAAREQWKDEVSEQIELWKDRELDRVDRIETEAWVGWDRSKRDAEMNRTTTSPDGDTTVTELKGQSGDPSFLKVVLKCVEERCKILGLYAPKKSDVTSGGSPIKYIGGVLEDQV